ncbi:hypothetical protein [Psychrobacter sp. I-STPA6b]|uniref:hypothetical protein n=1 Tax=Psychrobacter sp. I-STPA6b TaxID=2585718 RepID=UPI001D0CA432|nr:hypothetical protein [Psychrobacter sp. I-STPA6b]
MRTQIQPKKQSPNKHTLTSQQLSIEKKRQALARLAGSWKGDELRVEQPLSDVNELNNIFGKYALRNKKAVSIEQMNAIFTNSTP